MHRHQDLLMKFQMISVEKNEMSITELMMILNFNQDNSLDFDEEYRSPGWDRYKKNKMLKWKK